GGGGRRADAGGGRRPGPRRSAGRLSFRSALHVRDAPLAQRPAGATRLARWPRAVPLSAGRHNARCAHEGRPAGGRDDAVSAIVAASDLVRSYQVRRGLFRKPSQLRAVGGISFALERGKTLAIIGESGCGKSPLARLVTLMERPTAGRLTLDGIDVRDPPAATARRLRRTVQLVFQNPYGSLNPRKKIGAILEAPLIVNTDLASGERRSQVIE